MMMKMNATTVYIMRDERFQQPGIAVYASIEDALKDAPDDDIDAFEAALEQMPSCPESDAALADNGFLGECPISWRVGSSPDATWRYAECAADDDAIVFAADLVAADGQILASCLVCPDETDTESDGCGVFAAGLRSDDIDWPSWDDAVRATHADVAP